MFRKLTLRLKFYISFLRKGRSYADFFTSNTYKIYLNHSKIIHFRDGCPVFSLSTPALFSNAAANFMARNFYKNITGRTNHNLMSLAITEKCNASCEHCSFHTKDLNEKKNPLKKQEYFKIIKDAQEAGVTVINIVGGEPLLNPDIFEIISSVDKNLSTAILFTNGYYLSQNAKKLKNSGLDGVYVSIDSAKAKKHDKFRKIDNLFEKAMEGIESAKKTGLTVGISSCVTPKSFKNGELHGIVELAKKKGVHEVLVFGANPSGKYAERQDLADDHVFIDELIEFSNKYNKSYDYPGILIYGYTSSHRSIGCSGGVNYFYINPFGEVCPCDFNHAVFGNVRETPLYEILEKMRLIFKHTKYGGCRLKDKKIINDKYISKDKFNKINI
ncbi:MAG: radical SAM protein [Candidatus Pacebacteria bacterium]|nr:radical SAM protein [Candidatus Paceibacterota bacterium]